jgi:RNA-directed DNA polymerase
MLEEKPSAEVVATPKRAEEIAWMEASVWTPRMIEALDKGVEGGRWYSLIDKVHRKENLKASYERTKRNKGTHGVDNISIRFFGKYLDENLERLTEEIKAGRYCPQRLRRIYIPKPGSGEKRPISIPTVRDRVVQGAVKHVIEPIFERTFADTSYGFRPNRNAKQALRRVERELNRGSQFVIDCDIKNFFDTIPQDKLMAKVGERITDSKLLALVEKMLRQGIMDTHHEWTPTKGTPQGGVISPLLANIYLNGLDHQLIEDGAEPTRYADDLVALCGTRAEAERVLARIRTWAEEHGLELHPTKTRIVDMGQPGAEVDFLGYTFKRTGAGKLIRYPRKRSMERIKETIRQHTKRTMGVSLPTTINRVNRAVRGWFNYFQDSTPNIFPTLDGFVRRRLRAILLKRCGNPGFGNGWSHQRWPNAYFTEHGLFSTTVARASAVYPA